jgi:hypothetical protein
MRAVFLQTTPAWFFARIATPDQDQDALVSLQTNLAVETPEAPWR